MKEFQTDILEDEILSTFGAEVLERLLRCHSYEHARKNVYRFVPRLYC